MSTPSTNSTMTPPTIPDLWDLIEAANAVQAQKLHLVPGSPPRIRNGEGELSYLAEDILPLTTAQITGMLCRVVDPDRWSQLDDTGEGEVGISRDGGRRLAVSLYRSMDSWCAVVHL